MSPAARPIARVPGAKAIVVLFIAAITTPALGLAIGFDRRVVSESEMRELASWPAWEWRRDAAIEWPAQFQQYFEDHFALRARLIDARSRLMWSWLGTPAFDTVIAGRGDWLFYADDGALRDWVQSEPFPAEELEDWRKTLVARRAFLARRGIPFLFVIAADKHMIYPEHMPEHLLRMRDDYRADQLVAYVRQTTPDFPILDLRHSLLEAKSSELLYHRYDTHWNDRGALVAYQTIARELQRWFPALAPLRREDFETDPTVPSGDKTTMLGLVDKGKQAMPGLVLRGGARHRVIAPARPDAYGEDPLLIIEHVDQSLPTAMVFRDSFGARLIPYLSEHFRHVEYFWQNELDYEEIVRQRPDVVIQEFVARHFFTYGPYRPLIPE
jgi:alginate O-acetyltransferase complex protein AlgJ